MKLNPTRSPVVVLGAWNPAIFSPPWVGRHFFDGAPPQLQLGFAPDMFMRFVTPQCTFAVFPAQAQFVPVRSDDAALIGCEVAARRAVDLLPETPVHAVGINFSFDVPEVAELISEVFGLADSERVGAVRGAVAATTIRRRFQLESHFANVSLERDMDGKTRLDFNHHFDVPDARAASGILNGAAMAWKAWSVDFARNVYTLGVEAE